jgi:ribosome-associated translation inhibitor RaiA
MQTTITTRHTDVSDELRATAEAVVERNAGLASRPIEATVVFDQEGPRSTVEIRLHVSRGEVFIAHGAAAAHRTALDQADEKLRRQVEKAFARPRRSRPLEEQQP